jgi:beta-1,4-mannosyltransferase
MQIAIKLIVDGPFASGQRLREARSVTPDVGCKKEHTMRLDKVVPPGSADRPLVVVAQASDAPSGDNPYTRLLYQHMPDHGIVVHSYTRRALLTEHPDIVHIHWPEFLVRWHDGALRAFIDVFKELALLWLARQRGAKVIWTAHDLGAHDRPDLPRLYSCFVRGFNKMVDRMISLSPAALQAVIDHYPELRSRPADIIAHGHYRGYYQEKIASDREIAGLHPCPSSCLTFLIFGQLRWYKNVTGLIDAFALLGKGFRLIVAGEIRGSEDFRAEITLHAASTPGVHLVPRRIEDADVWALHQLADVVILPYRQGTALHSGAAILALSLGKPVVVRDTPTMRDLQAMVGAAWVALFDGTPTNALHVAKMLGQTTRATQANLADLDPSRTAAQTFEAYRAALRS